MYVFRCSEVGSHGSLYDVAMGRCAIKNLQLEVQLLGERDNQVHACVAVERSEKISALDSAPLTKRNEIVRGKGGGEE